MTSLSSFPDKDQRSVRKQPVSMANLHAPIHSNPNSHGGLGAHGVHGTYAILPPAVNPALVVPSNTAIPSIEQSSRERSLVLCTLDHEHFILVDVSDYLFTSTLRQMLCKRFRVPDWERTQVFVTELGEGEKGNPLSDDDLLELCHKSDSKGTLKFYLRCLGPSPSSISDIMIYTSPTSTSSSVGIPAAGIKGHDLPPAILSQYQQKINSRQSNFMQPRLRVNTQQIGASDREEWRLSHRYSNSHESNPDNIFDTEYLDSSDSKKELYSNDADAAPVINVIPTIANGSATGVNSVPTAAAFSSITGTSVTPAAASTPIITAAVAPPSSALSRTRRTSEISGRSKHSEEQLERPSHSPSSVSPLIPSVSPLTNSAGALDSATESSGPAHDTDGYEGDDDDVNTVEEPASPKLSSAALKRSRVLITGHGDSESSHAHSPAVGKAGRASNTTEQLRQADSPRMYLSYPARFCRLLLMVNR